MDTTLQDRLLRNNEALRESAYSRYSDRLNTINRGEERLLHCIAEYRRTRVMEVTPQLIDALRPISTDPVSIGAALAEEMKRKYIYTLHRSYSPYGGYDRVRDELTVPTGNCMENLVSGLLLVAQEDAGADKYDKWLEKASKKSYHPPAAIITEQPLTFSKTSKHWRFYAYTNEGKLAIRGFIDRCTNDSLFRLIIGR